MREWYERHPGYASDMARKHRERAREYERHKYHNDPEFRQRKLSRMALVQAVKRGKVERQPCEVCGKKNAEAHHDDYSKPLDVRWLCKTHHEHHHNKTNAQR